MKSRNRTAFSIATAIGMVSLPGSIAADEAEAQGSENVVIEAGRTVSIEFTLTIDAGETIDTNVGGEPLTYQHGSGGPLPPALEAELTGLGAGASKKVDLAPEQGFGPVREELYVTVAAAELPEEARKVGAVLFAQSPTGQQRPVRVHEVKGDEVVIDHNHPLAGQSLHFAIKVLSVE